MKRLRNAGIIAEIYPESAKMKKQMAYADSKSIPFVAMTGETEIADNVISLKNMLTGEQRNVSPEELLQTVK